MRVRCPVSLHSAGDINRSLRLEVVSAGYEIVEMLQRTMMEVCVWNLQSQRLSARADDARSQLSSRLQGPCCRNSRQALCNAQMAIIWCMKGVLTLILDGKVEDLLM